MAAATIDIGTLITQSPETSSDRPRVAGTGVRVRTVVTWYKQGLTPEAIGRKLSHLTLAQVYAALTYYHANRAAIDEDIAAEEAFFDEMEQRKSTGSS